MADQLQLRGGTTTEHSTFVGAAREVTIDITKNSLVVHDGVTVGGYPLPTVAALAEVGTIVAAEVAAEVGAIVAAEVGTIVAALAEVGTIVEFEGALV